MLLDLAQMPLVQLAIESEMPKRRAQREETAKAGGHANISAQVQAIEVGPTPAQYRLQGRQLKEANL
jgi:hypothetical protein